MENKMLDKLGKIVITEVRDRALLDSQKLLEGNVKAPRLVKLVSDLELNNLNNKALLQKIVIEAVDDVVFNFLNMLEQNDDKLKLLYIDDKYGTHNVVELSDGLAGELFSEDGWIERFSEYG